MHPHPHAPPARPQPGPAHRRLTTHTCEHSHTLARSHTAPVSCQRRQSRVKNSPPFPFWFSSRQIICKCRNRQKLYPMKQEDVWEGVRAPQGLGWLVPRSRVAAWGPTPGLDTCLWQGAAACQSPWVCTLHMWGCAGCLLPLLVHPALPAAPTIPAQPGIPRVSVHPVGPASRNGQSHPLLHQDVKGCVSPTSMGTESLFSCPSLPVL